MKASLLVSAALLIPTVLFAQEPQGGAGSGASAFDMLDADKNSSISQTEAQAHPVVSQNFGAADRNGDRVLTRDEFDSAFVSAEPSDEPPAPAPTTPDPET
jgi:hypothetical protein